MTDENGSGKDELHLVADELGQLLAVTFSEFEPGWVESVHFDFDFACLRVDADGDYDTIKWEIGPKRDTPIAATPDPWKALLFNEVRWIWILTNHRGFTDGLQIEFNDERNTAVQMMVEASRLRLYKLSAWGL